MRTDAINESPRSFDFYNRPPETGGWEIVYPDFYEWEDSEISEWLQDEGVAGDEAPLSWPDKAQEVMHENESFVPITIEECLESFRIAGNWLESGQSRLQDRF